MFDIDLPQDLINIYLWYFLSWNSVSVLGAIWPPLSPWALKNHITFPVLPFPTHPFLVTLWSHFLCSLFTYSPFPNYPLPDHPFSDQSRKLNSASAMPSNVQHDTSAAQSDENEMDLNITTPKRAIHEVSSEEEPTSPLPTKRTAPGPLASGQGGTFVPKGSGRGGLSKISTFCPNPPRSGGQGSSGRDRSPVRLRDGTKPSVPPKPANQSKSKNDKNSPY